MNFKRGLLIPLILGALGAAHLVGLASADTESQVPCPEKTDVCCPDEETYVPECPPPTTDPPVTTEPPSTTEPPVTTEPPSTTEPPLSTIPPPTTEPPIVCGDDGCVPPPPPPPPTVPPCSDGDTRVGCIPPVSVVRGSPSQTG
jgi:hypothetical protein